MSYESIKKQLEEANKPLLEDSILKSKEKYDKQTGAVNTVYDTQKTNTESGYKSQITDAKEAYDNEYRKNAVQKSLNEMKLAERVENLGLKNSGLNNTQETAIQLSYANNRGELDRNRRKAIDALNLAMTTDISTIEANRTAKLAEIDTNRIAEEDSIRQNYANNIASQAQSIYKAELDAETARIKAAQQAAAKQYKNTGDNTGTAGGKFQYKVQKYDDDTVTFIDSNGKSTEYSKGINPYTGHKVNVPEKYGAFTNGYQPKGIIDSGTDYGKVYGTGLTDDITGKIQTVWQTTNGGNKYWLWWDDYDKYIEITDPETLSEIKARLS